ncbi:uncharacterized protein bub1ba [Micropterus salmoides]|uniref:uncharacterized protein bub1ba n=1 Tax=Micropterus salmoides TaxID=27706 RepID=UPI0018ECB91E|nr:uncharacterized protein bub1ba [Micropterus salmoides]
MAEGLPVQVGPSAYQSEPSSTQTHPIAGAGHQEEGVVSQRPEYCIELLTRGREEFSFEELRAERYFKRREEREIEEKLRRGEELKKQLRKELEEKKRLVELMKSQMGPEGSASRIRDAAGPPAAASFQIYEDSRSAAAARPAGTSDASQDKLQDDVFLRPDERGLCLKVQCPQQGFFGTSSLPQVDAGIQPHNTNLPSAPQNGFTQTPTVVQTSVEPVSKTRQELSPIQETSVEANSLTSLGMSAGHGSPLQEDQDQEELDPVPSHVGGAVDPCDPDVRRRLLELCDVTSSPDFHSEPRPLPEVETDGFLQLGGRFFTLFPGVLDRGSFSVYKGTTEDHDHVLIKVDSCSVPWDFHQFQRLKKNSAAAAGLPLISCFLFLDGCITVYKNPAGYKFTELTERAPTELLVGYKVLALLHLVSQLHSCRLLHAGLQPSVLTCSKDTHRGSLSPDSVFPVDWSSSVDLDLQQGVTSVQQIPSAQAYITLGLLEPTAPPELVDLVGVAETVHLLLTNSRMVAVKDEGGWTAEWFSEDKPSVLHSRKWTSFFRTLLNAGGRSSLSVLSELQEQLSALFA